MALALERGSQMQAPLGRAVIGGLVMSTFATLLVVPSVFALVIGKKTHRSPSIYPDDRESRYYDPNVFASRPDKEKQVRHEQPDAHELIAHHTDDEVIGLLRSMIREIRQKRAEMVTHHSADDLLGPLGFTKGAKAEGEGRDQGGKDGANPGSEGMS
jgi:hypothetical protein